MKTGRQVVREAKREVEKYKRMGRKAEVGIEKLEKNRDLNKYGRIGQGWKKRKHSELEISVYL